MNSKNIETEKAQIKHKQVDNTNINIFCCRVIVLTQHGIFMIFLSWLWHKILFQKKNILRFFSWVYTAFLEFK